MAINRDLYRRAKGLFDKVFGGSDRRVYSAYALLNGTYGSFTPYSGDAWDNDTVRAAVDAFARRAAIVQPRHIRRENGREVNQNDGMNRLLQFAPNPYSTAYKFYYRLASNYKIFNGAFVYPVWETSGSKVRLKALYNINTSDAELVEYQGEMFVRFRFSNGNSYAVPFDEVIYIGRHFLDHDIFGSDNRPATSAIATAEAFNQSMIKQAEMIGAIRGTLEVEAPKRDDLMARRDEFIRDNLRIESGGAGIIVTNSRARYTPIKDTGGTAIPEAQLKYVKSAIYSYYGTSEEIVTNSETSDQATGFYEGELKPFFAQLSQAFTNCLFSDRERGCGSEIVADINTLQYAKISEKLATVRYLSDIGALSMDQALTTMGFPPIGGEEGQRRVQTLNMVNAQKADQYQLGEPSKEPKEGETKEGEQSNAV